MKKIILLVVFIRTLYSCQFLPLPNEEFTIFPQEDDILILLDSTAISNTINDYSVGTFIEVSNQKYFIPINYEYYTSGVGKYRVPIADLIITEDINKYHPIYFKNADENSKNTEFLNAIWCFLPSEDPKAITIEKLISQFTPSYYDNNSIMNEETVILFDYDQEKKGFYVFHASGKIDNFWQNVPEIEKQYYFINLLRLAKNLNNLTAKEMDWSKLSYVIPPYLHRYNSEELIEELSTDINEMLEGEIYNYEYENLDISFSILKSEYAKKLLADFQKTKVNSSFDYDAILSKESQDLLNKYFNMDEIDLERVDNIDNYYSYKSKFDILTFHKPKEKDFLICLKTDNSSFKYNTMIISRCLDEVLFSKL